MQTHELNASVKNYLETGYNIKMLPYLSIKLIGIFCKGQK